jgi:hypothetical protein
MFECELIIQPHTLNANIVHGKAGEPQLRSRLNSTLARLVPTWRFFCSIVVLTGVCISHNRLSMAARSIVELLERP